MTPYQEILLRMLAENSIINTETSDAIIAAIDAAKAKVEPGPEPIGRTPGVWSMSVTGHILSDVLDSDRSELWVAKAPAWGGTLEESYKHWPANARWFIQCHPGGPIETFLRGVMNCSRCQSCHDKARELLDSLSGKSENPS